MKAKIYIRCNAAWSLLVYYDSQLQHTHAHALVKPGCKSLHTLEDDLRPSPPGPRKSAAWPIRNIYHISKMIYSGSITRLDTKANDVDCSCIDIARLVSCASSSLVLVDPFVPCYFCKVENLGLQLTIYVATPCTDATSTTNGLRQNVSTATV